MRKNRILKHGLAAILVAAAMTAVAGAEPPSGASDSRQTAYLGVHIDAVTPQQASAMKLAAPSGAVITDLDQDGPACRAGLKENDVIVGLNGSKIESPDQLGNAIRGTQPGKTVTVTVVRKGETKDLKVTLGTWPQAKVPGKAFFGAAPRPQPPVAATLPDIEMPSISSLSSRHGLMVENLCPQLAEFFSVPPGTGVLVRSVEKGSPAEAAGLKAGDVIVKLNNETIHDLADWRRVQRVQASQMSVTVVREKREQTVVMHLPAPADSSQVFGPDWADFADQMQAEMENWQPQFEVNQEMLAELMPSQQEMEQMRGQMAESMKIRQKDMEKMTREILKSVPTQEQLDQIQREVQESMKNLTPQLQQEMKALQKQMEQHQLDWQQMLKGLDNQQQY